MRQPDCLLPTADTIGPLNVDYERSATSGQADRQAGPVRFHSLAKAGKFLARYVGIAELP